MNPTEIEFALRDLIAKPYDPESFAYDLIGIYNASKMTVSRLKNGLNKAKEPGDLLWQKHVFIRSVSTGSDIGAIGDTMAADSQTTKHKPRFILVTDGEQVHMRDLKFADTENVEYARLDEKSDFLLPLAGYERRSVAEEHPADIKAAKKLKKLYDAILAANPTWSAGHHTHELNLLMTRLLFCFYAEDTGIFDTPQLFTNTLTQHTSEDGSDVAPLIDRLFRIMNVEDAKRPKSASAVETKFPYVNGSLFEDTVEIPQFSRTARRQLLECGDLDWTTINPDIFGSMIQTIAQDGTRSDLGMHYTSVPNIMKVLQPLFLDNLYDAFQKAKDSVSKLEALLGRLSRVRVFDPACGSGNFLIIAYKELRKIEMETLERIAHLAPNAPLRLSGISLQHFYGIDLVDFACETAKLSLWIAEHQMNSMFKEVFGAALPTLPLARISTVHNGNALRMDWQAVCPLDATYETYLCGNPPYAGYQFRTSQQKADLDFAIGRFTSHFKSMDYITGWFILAAEYARNSNTRYAVVSTNSICQGEQVSMLWPVMFDFGAQINFAYTSFEWANNASHNAGVTCIIVGLSARAATSNVLITREHQRVVDAIGPYLVADPARTIVTPRRSPASTLPEVQLGNNPTDGGHLLLSPQERDVLISSQPGAARFIKRYVGTNDFLNNVERFCLWIEDDDLEVALRFPFVKARIEAVAASRRASPSQEIRDSAIIPHRFRRAPDGGRPALVIPHITSDRRQYFPVGLVGSDTILNNTAYAIYEPPAFMVALLSSRQHLVWAATVGGKFRTHIRYSNTLIYNTFPVPLLSDEQKLTLSEHSKAIIKARALHPSKSLAELYDPESMPENLLETLRENDAYIDEHVYGRKYRDDTHRLEHLFAMYASIKAREETPLLAAGNGSTKKAPKHA